LVLVLISDFPRKYRYFIGAGAVFLVYLFIQYLIAPVMFRGFIRNALSVVGESGAVGPSTSKFVKEIFILISKILGPVSPTLISVIVVGLTAIVILLSARAYLQLQRLQDEDRQKMILFLVCLVYALIHPRLKDYAYMLLIVPSYFIMKNTRFTRAFPFIFVFAIMASPRLMLPGIDILSSVAWQYFPLIIAYTIWGLYLYEIFSSAKNEAAPHPVKQARKLSANK
ncbi:MAG: hypothetical protein P8X85_24505, partial [Desulfobacterales bacterium]